MQLDVTAGFGQCRGMNEPPLYINGSGNTACVTALALAQAGFRPHIFMPEDKPDEKSKAALPLWQNVLALSPSAKTMLEKLGVWQKLTAPTAMVCDMAVYGSARDWAHEDGLSFSDNRQKGQEDAQNIEALAHIVSLADLGRSLRAALDRATADGRIAVLEAPIADFDPATGAARLANGAQAQLGLLIDCHGEGGPWRRDLVRLSHDYHMQALVGEIETERPHGQTALQLFLPSGPLALLPLPDPRRRAMIWSLPSRRAQALADAPTAMLQKEIADATAEQAGAVTPIGPMATQELRLRLADVYTDGHLCLLGEAGHLVHPLAGQGFNLSLRDAALLVDCLYDAKKLGLAANGPQALVDFNRKRRTDAALTAAATHGLAQLFSGPATALTGPLGRLGLRLTGQLAEAAPAVKHAFTRQADGAARGALPRLMRGHDYS